MQHPWHTRAALLLALTLTTGTLSGCQSPSKSPETEETPSLTSFPVLPTETIPSEEPTYTFRIGTTSLPDQWNCHTADLTAEVNPLEYTLMPLYDVVLDDTTGYRFQPELAAADPVDVTSLYATEGNLWNIPVGADSGYVWQVSLNPNACWEDGTPITAQDYVDSMEDLLDPQLSNSNRTIFTSHEGELVNAAAYAASNMTTTADCTPMVGDSQDGVPTFQSTDGMTLYGSVSQSTTYFGCSLLEAVDGPAAEAGCSPEALDLLAQIVSIYSGYEDEYGYFPATEEYCALLEEFLALDSPDLSQGTLYFLYGLPDSTAVTEFSQVGIQALDDTTLVFFLVNAVSAWDFTNTIGTARFLVNQPLYDGGRTEVSTNYATSVETFSSCGPYRLDSVSESEITLVKNEQWYGWTDGAHEGEYQTTHITIQALESYDSGLIAFLSGNLSTFDLDGQDVDMYENSSAMVGAVESTTFRLSINSSVESLSALEDGSSNVTILAEETFRDALSCAIDRSALAKFCNAGGLATVGLLNRSYYVDLEDDSTTYRDTIPAMTALCDLYGVSYTAETLAEDAASITGYDPTTATLLFQQAAEAALLNETWDGEAISIAVSVQTLTTEQASVINTIQQQVQQATVGTLLEGKLSIRAKENPALLTDPSKYAMALTAWSGYETSPIDLLGCYIDVAGGWCGEYGFPYDQALTLVIDGAEVTQTLFDWYQSAKAGGIYDTASQDTRLTILAGLEQAVLDVAQAIPLYSTCDYQMVSKQVELGSQTYHILTGFGGLRHITYRMTDSEWEEYIHSNAYSAAIYKN